MTGPRSDAAVLEDNWPSRKRLVGGNTGTLLKLPRYNEM